MRTIKFRGKRLDNGRWVEGSFMPDYIHHKSGASIVINGVIWHEVEPSTVGQFTGLHDKEGNEIYEGDLLEDQVKDISVIEWNKYDACFTINWISSGVDLYQSMENENIQHFKKIGNIHDNPKLLKQ